MKRLPHRCGRRPAVVAAVMLALTGCAAGPPPVPDSLDATDLQLMTQTRQTALESSRIGESANWRNPATGHLGTVTPVRTLERNGGSPCRDYQLTATVGGRTDIAYDTACRRADGVWTSRGYAEIADVLRYGNPDRYRRDPYYDDPWCRWPPRGYDPWCRPRSGLSLGVGVGL